MSIDGSTIRECFHATREFLAVHFEGIAGSVAFVALPFTVEIDEYVAGVLQAD